MADGHASRPLDGLLELLADSGEQLVLTIPAAPKDHVLRLMETLGVTVKVDPLMANLLQHSQREQERGRAAQDYRSSRARALRRLDAGDSTLTSCQECGCETDFAPQPHDPKCSFVGAVSEAPPVGEEEGSEVQLSEGSVKKKMERGRDGQLRSTQTHHMVNGKEMGLTAGEMQRRHDAVLDAMPLKVGCAVEGCEWPGFEGPAADAREVSRAHRESEHPGLSLRGKRRRKLAPGQTDQQATAAAVQASHRAALEAMDAGDPQAPDLDVDVDIEEPAIEEGLIVNAVAEPLDAERKPDITPDIGRRDWTREEIIAAIQAHAAANDGFPPASTEWFINAPGRPNATKVKRVFGSWADAVEAAGFPRPTRGGNGKRRTTTRAERLGLDTNSNSGQAQEHQAPPIVWAVKVDGTGLRYRTTDEAYAGADEIEHDGERVAREARIAGQDGKADQAIDASRDLANKIRAAADAAGGQELETSGVGKTAVSGSAAGTGEEKGASQKLPARPERPAAPTFWTPETIVAAIQEWAKTHDGPPTAEEWKKRQAGYPSQSTVASHFGSWSKGIAAAGLTPRTRGGQQVAGEVKAGPRAHPSPAAAPAPSLVTSAPSLEVAKSEVQVDAPPVSPFVLALTGDFGANAQRVKDEAEKLRRQAEALDVIAQGLGMLEETVAA